MIIRKLSYLQYYRFTVNYCDFMTSLINDANLFYCKQYTAVDLHFYYFCPEIDNLILSLVNNYSMTSLTYCVHLVHFWIWRSLDKSKFSLFYEISNYVSSSVKFRCRDGKYFTCFIKITVLYFHILGFDRCLSGYPFW